eukprot:297102-Heterocapsa_arctica.AAC.1
MCIRDSSDDDNGEHFPGCNIRKEAYNRVAGNHKDNVFQQTEEQEAKQLNTIIKLNQLKDKEAQSVCDDKSNEKHAAEHGIEQQMVGGNHGTGHTQGEPNEDIWKYNS